MRIAIVGPGRIGSNCARQFAKARHEVVLTFSRDAGKLEQVAADVGGTAVADPAEAVAGAEVVVLSVPWRVIDDALAQVGSLDGKIVIDTTNQYGAGGVETFPGGQTAAQHNAARMPGARYTKSFNTLTSGFQADAAGRQGDDRVVQWVCGDDPEASAMVCALIEEAGYAAVDLGGTATCQVMEAPRRPGAVYGEEYRAADAQAVVDPVRTGSEIPPTPSYS
jgi:8-hydroxy-5-deazaflavin:NADPH oxidoreductase